MINYITLYHDAYETNYGDGFYPSTYPGGTKIEIGFELYDGVLTQVTGPRINGYDGDTRNNIIQKILEHNEVKCPTCNTYIIYDEIRCLVCGT